MSFQSQVAVLLVSLVAISVTNEEDCVSNYKEFREATFKKTVTDDNQFKLHSAFYPPNGRQPYSVEVTYQTTLSNGTVVDIITDGAGYRNKVWVWLSSPFFLKASPEFLNSIVLRTLNNFIVWVPPKLNIVVPNPCRNKTFDFLETMTAYLSDYISDAAILNKKKSGNVVIKRIKGGGIFSSLPRRNGTKPSTKAQLYSTLVNLCVVGFIFVTVLLWTVFFAAIKSRVRGFVAQMNHYSYQYYGLAWGGCVVTVGLLGALWYGLVSSFSEIQYTDIHELGEKEIFFLGMSVFCMTMFALPGIPIAVYFACKTTPPPVPYMFLLPAALLCCCKRRYAQSMVFGLGMFLYMTGLQVIIGTAVVGIYVMLAEPLIMITNALIVTLMAFCFTNIFALLFTISAYIFTPRGSRRMQKPSTMLKAVLLVPLFFAIPLIGVGIVGTVGMSTQDSSNVLAIIGSAMVPLVIGALMFALKELVVNVFDFSHEPLKGDVATSNSPLLRNDSSYNSINSEP